MHYTIYKITNKINGKIYIGQHKTENVNDDYMGSGKLIRLAIVKYGIENFDKEILFDFDTREEMILKEKELVDNGFRLRDDTYNIALGGHGDGWHFVNVNGKRGSGMLGKRRSDISKSRISAAMKNRTMDDEWKRKISEAHKGKAPRLKGTIMDSEFREKMKRVTMGEKNSQFGTMWINDGSTAKKIKSSEVIPNGWTKGRKTKQLS
jgi:group I intron endonuclease